MGHPDPINTSPSSNSERNPETAGHHTDQCHRSPSSMPRLSQPTTGIQPNNARAVKFTKLRVFRHDVSIAEFGGTEIANTGRLPIQQVKVLDGIVQRADQPRLIGREHDHRMRTATDRKLLHLIQQFLARQNYTVDDFAPSRICNGQPSLFLPVRQGTTEIYLRE